MPQTYVGEQFAGLHEAVADSMNRETGHSYSGVDRSLHSIQCAMSCLNERARMKKLTESRSRKSVDFCRSQFIYLFISQQSTQTHRAISM